MLPSWGVSSAGVDMMLTRGLRVVLSWVWSEELELWSPWRLNQGCWYHTPVCVPSRRIGFSIFDPENSLNKSTRWSQAWAQDGSLWLSLASQNIHWPRPMSGACLWRVLLSTQEVEMSSGAVCRTRPYVSQVKSTTSHPEKYLDRDPSHWLWSRGSMVL